VFVAMYSVGLPPVCCMYVLIVLSFAGFVVATYSAGLPPVHCTCVQCWIATVFTVKLTYAVLGCLLHAKLSVDSHGMLPQDHGLLGWEVWPIILGLGIGNHDNGPWGTVYYWRVKH